MKKALSYIVLTVLLAYGVREFLYSGIRKNKVGEYEKLNTLFVKKNSFDCLILGSSRAESHVNSTVIDSITHFNSYNCGLEGATMPLIWGTLKAYLENSAMPQYILLNIDCYPFHYKGEVINRFPRYFSYLKNKTLYTTLKTLDPRYVGFKHIPFYSMAYFNDTYLNASIRGYTGAVSGFDQTFRKGYAPVPAAMQKELDTLSLKSYISNPEPIIFSHLDSILQFSNAHNIKLILFLSPMYYKGTEAIINKEELVGKFKSIASEYSYPFLDYSGDSICYSADYFADPYHLNKKGSEAFSQKLAQDVKLQMK